MSITNQRSRKIFGKKGTEIYWSSKSAKRTKNKTPHLSLPSDHFTISEPENPRIDASELHNISRSTDFKGLKLLNVRSGSSFMTLPLNTKGQNAFQFIESNSKYLKQFLFFSPLMPPFFFPFRSLRNYSNIIPKLFWSGILRSNERLTSWAHAFYSPSFLSSTIPAPSCLCLAGVLLLYNFTHTATGAKLSIRKPNFEKRTNKRNNKSDLLVLWPKTSSPSFSLLGILYSHANA